MMKFAHHLAPHSSHTFKGPATMGPASLNIAKGQMQKWQGAPLTRPHSGSSPTSNPSADWQVHKSMSY